MIRASDLVRIQRKRTKGWRMPEDAVYVGRPTVWGNRFPVCPERTPRRAVDQFENWISAMYRHPYELREWLRPLRGKNLVCWCPLDQPCHADVLLELANA